LKPPVLEETVHPWEYDEPRKLAVFRIEGQPFE
jgi:hypothetical protein